MASLNFEETPMFNICLTDINSQILSENLETLVIVMSHRLIGLSPPKIINELDYTCARSFTRLEYWVAELGYTSCLGEHCNG